MAYIITLLVLLLPVNVLAMQCGNGIREGIEECDNGAANSDTLPNACRTDCTRAHCGDSVTDANEQCDDGDYGNSDKIPGACRTNCKNAFCGDGVVDYNKGEQCDDNDVGCTECRTCLKPQDELMVQRGYDGQYVLLCPGDYTIYDAANNGVILVAGSDLIVDCSHISLHSAGFINAPTVPPRQKPKTPLRKLFKPLSFNFVGEANAAPGSGPIARQGVGFVVTGSNNTLVNCRADGFAVGIQFKGNNNTLVNGSFCGNSLDIKNEGINDYGNNNQCTSHLQWKDASTQSGCSQQCQ